ncbi:uracil-DNA glycosylase [Mycoplasmopsis meleagridis]|uniref:uracil-DNA glycosylase n=1 Tax=Mycoplasmopsis meleagridis TaxID=29561 RepID=UPI003A8A5192
MKNSFLEFLKEECKKEYFAQMLHKIEHLEKSGKKILPVKKLWFRAFNYCEINDIKVIILGQDPYYIDNMADGLAFSSNLNITPKSLINIKEEIRKDYPETIFETNSLVSWAKQGILLLNTILTVIENRPLSNKNIGWEIFTSNLLNKFVELKKPIVLVLWGEKAKQFYENNINKNNNFKILNFSHPSPLSYKTGKKPFYNSHCFKLINDLLEEPIDFSIRKE